MYDSISVTLQEKKTFLVTEEVALPFTQVQRFLLKDTLKLLSVNFLLQSV